MGGLVFENTIYYTNFNPDCSNLGSNRKFYLFEKKIIWITSKTILKSHCTDFVEVQLTDMVNVHFHTKT